MRGLQQQIEELCDALQQLSQAAADGPCWCGVATDDPTFAQHTAKCQRARTALGSGRLSRDAPCEPAPGYGHDV